MKHSQGVYNTAKLVDQLTPELSVRTFQGRYYLVDDKNDKLIAEAIQGASVEWASNDPRLWAIGRLERRIDAINREVSKYETRIRELQSERERLEQLDKELE